LLLNLLQMRKTHESRINSGALPSAFPGLATLVSAARRAERSEPVLFYAGAGLRGILPPNKNYAAGI